MKKTSTRVIVLLTFVFAFCVPNVQANTGSTAIHDPSAIIKHNGLYHIWGTGNQITHLTSTDLVNWKPAATVFPAGTWPVWINTYIAGFTGNFWAPDIIGINGTYYLYYTCSTGGNVSAIGLATSTDLVNWTDKGMVIHTTSTSNYVAVDPAVFADATGKYWMTFGSHYTGIYIAQIDPATGKRMDASVTNIAGGSSDDHKASYVMYDNGYYYLFYNRGACCLAANSTNYIQMGRSAHPAGPYTDKNGVSLLQGGGTTVLASSGRYIGPGQLGVYKENGRNRASMHFYDKNSSGTAKLDVARLDFGADGWPVITRDILPNGRYVITNKNSGLAWEAQGCTGAAGQKLVQNTPNAAAICQQWDLTSVGNGYYKLKSVKTASVEQVVDLPFCNTSNGTLLGTWDWLNNDCQKFKIEQLADGNYVISTIGNPNRVIEVPGASTAAGAQLGLYDYNEFTCQQWVISKAGSIEAPVVSQGENITTGGFTAKWEPVAGATGYKLDVSFKPDFTTATGSPFITGYENISVNTTSYTVTGLSANAFYYYRVRAVKDGETSPNSNTGSVYTAGAVDNGFHDPSSLVKDGNTYWAFGTGYGNNNTGTNDKSTVPFTLSSSTDLFKWTRASKPVFPAGTWPAWINSFVPDFAGIFWAPEVVFMNNKYYLYYSVSAFGSPRSAIGLATSPTLDQNSPDYAWTDQGMVVSSGAVTQVNAIDPAILLDDDGRVWMSYGSFAAGIGVVELDPVSGLKKPGATVTIVAGGNQSAWEAPFIVKEGGYYYLFANRQYCCALLNSTYYVVAGRSASITGPYTDKNGTGLKTTSSGTVVGTTILESSGKYIGPGHIGLLKENGRNLLTMHYYDATSNGYPRIDVARLQFSADKWPVITRDLLPEGRYRIKNKSSNLVWESSGCTGAGGQPLVQNQQDAGALCQQWDLTPVGDGYYRIKNANGGAHNQVVDVPFCNVNNKLGTWDWLNNDCQKFKIDQLANGSYVISPYANGSVVVEAPYASAAPNTQLGLSLFNENPSQQWFIEVANNSPVAIVADAVSTTGFKAQWNAVPHASAYKVDVYTSADHAPVAATTIASWNFTSGNTATAANENNTGKTVVPVATAAATYAGTAMATGWNSGNGTKYWEAAQLNTRGHYGIKVSSRQRSNSTGPRHFKMQYKIGINGAYADVPGSYVTLADNYTSGFLQEVQLPAVCDNQPSVGIRWVMVTNTNVGNNTNTSAGTVSSTGQSNIDDITITGSKSPVYTFVPGYEDVTVNGTSVDISGLQPNTKYYYQVRSEVSGLLSGNSNAVAVTTLCETVDVQETITQVTCYGAENGAISLQTSGGAAPLTYSWTGPDNYSSAGTGISNLKPGDYTVTITQNNGCVSDKSYTITQPSDLVLTASNSNPQLYFGYSGDQASAVKGIAKGGVAPYTVSITMNRPLTCNYINDAGDETWFAATGSTLNNGCPAYPGLAAANPVSVISGVAEGGSYSVNVSLMQDAVFTITVTDANGCTKTATTQLSAEDVRCFSGNSGSSKVTLCHRTGNSKNPCIKICVDESNVEEHLAHGDYMGSCTPDCTAPAAITGSLQTGEHVEELMVKEPEIRVMNNPAQSRTSFRLNLVSNDKDGIGLRVMDGQGRLLENRQNLRPGQTVEIGSTYAQGVYFAEFLQGGHRKVVKLIKQ